MVDRALIRKFMQACSALLILVMHAWAGPGVWTSNGPDGGSVLALTAAPGGAVYAALRTAGVAKSRDNGASWSSVSTGLPTQIPVTALAPAADGSVYAAAGAAGVYKTSNGGANWLAVGAGFPANVLSLAVAGDGSVYAGTDGSGLFKSSNGGASWVAVNNTALPATAVVTALAIAPDGTVYCGAKSAGVYLSRDGGAGWALAYSAEYNYFVSRLIVATDGRIYVGVSATIPKYNKSAVANSSDGGKTWQLNYAFRGPITALTVGVDGSLYVGSDTALDILTLRTSGGGISRSRDGGGTFEAIDSGLQLEWGTDAVYALAVAADGSILAAYSDLGLFKSAKGDGNWVQSTQGLQGAPVRALALAPDGTVYAGTSSGVVKCVKGTSWVSASTGLPAFSKIDAIELAPDGTLYAATLSTIYKSVNSGTNWTAVYSAALYSDIESLAVRADGTVYAGLIQGMVKSGDKGASWVSVPIPTVYAYAVNAITVAADGSVYAATSRGLFKSSNGRDWTAVNGDLPNDISLYFNAITLAADGSLYGGSRGGVYKSSNGGANWTLLSTGLPADGNLYVDTTALTMSADGILYAGIAGHGVFKSIDGGVSWTGLSGGLPANTSIYKLAIAADGSVYAATNNGVYEYTPLPRLSNVSTRLNTQTGNNVAIAGFVISGGSKTVLLRALGPSLAAQGVPSVLANPQLRLVDANGTVVIQNTSWVTSSDAAAIKLSGMAPTSTAESAIIVTLAPGAYTAIMDGVNGTVGNALIAVDGGIPDPRETGAIINLSTRGLVGTGDNVMIAGIIVADGPRKVLVTARGPSLGAFGIANPLQNPVLELRDVNGVLIDCNVHQSDTSNNCGSGVVTTPDPAAIQATGKAPANSQESAILRTLAPGNYTAIVRGSNNGVGVALVGVDFVN